jgi:hypothetical protein
MSDDSGKVLQFPSDRASKPSARAIALQAFMDAWAQIPDDELRAINPNELDHPIEWQAWHAEYTRRWGMPYAGLYQQWAAQEADDDETPT